MGCAWKSSDGLHKGCSDGIGHLVCYLRLALGTLCRHISILQVWTYRSITTFSFSACIPFPVSHFVQFRIRFILVLNISAFLSQASLAVDTKPVRASARSLSVHFLLCALRFIYLSLIYTHIPI